MADKIIAVVGATGAQGGDAAAVSADAPDAAAVTPGTRGGDAAAVSLLALAGKYEHWP